MTTIINIREVRVCKRCQDVDSVGGKNRLEQYIQHWLESQNVVRLSDKAMRNLRLLAKHRNMSVDQCVEAMAVTCQPFGDNWVHPMNKGRK